MQRIIGRIRDADRARVAAPEGAPQPDGDIARKGLLRTEVGVGLLTRSEYVHTLSVGGRNRRTVIDIGVHRLHARDILEPSSERILVRGAPGDRESIAERDTHKERGDKQGAGNEPPAIAEDSSYPHYVATNPIDNRYLLIIENYPEGQVEELDAVNNPEGPRKNNFTLSRPSARHLPPLLNREILNVSADTPVVSVG